MSTAELLSQALTLSDAERAQLARSLLLSLDAPMGGGGDSSEELAVELQRRLDRMESGEGRLIDGAEAMAELQAAHCRRVEGSR